MILVTGNRSKKRQNVYRAAIFAWNYLMPRISKCDVYIEIKKLKDAHGYCLELDKREYEIEIDQRLKGDDLVTTVFHEMIHVRQGVRKQYQNINTINYKTYDEYMKLPWEIEAYELQEVMLKEWNKKNMKCLK
jgi:hypothetical protein